MEELGATCQSLAVTTVILTVDSLKMGTVTVGAMVKVQNPK